MTPYVTPSARPHAASSKLIASVCLLLSALASSAHAASDTWNTASGSWVTSGNWSGGNVPGATSGLVSTDVATFGSAGAGTVTVDAFRNLLGITFNSGSSSYVLSGGKVVLTDAATIQIASGGSLTNQTVNSAIDLAGSATFANLSTNSGSSLTFGGNITGLSATAMTLTLKSDNSLSFPATHNVISGVISNGSGGGVISLSTAGNDTRTNSNVWELTGANTYSGGTMITALGGILRVSNSNALGTGNVTINSTSGNNGVLQLTGNIALTGPSTIFLDSTTPTSAQIQNLSGYNSVNSNISSDASNARIESIAGKLTLLGSYTSTSASGGSTTQKTLYLLGAGDGEFSGRIFRTGTVRPVGIIKDGAGTWTLSNANGDNDYAGTTTVIAGTFLVNTNNTFADGAISVRIGATFGGNGINGGAATFDAGSFLAPGSSSGVAGNITFTKTVDISGLSSGTGGLKFNLGGVGTSDQVTLTTGALTIGTLDIGDFNFTTLSGFGVGTYTLFSTTQSIAGSLGSNLTGTLGGFNIALAMADSNTDLVLTVTSGAGIPEPSTYAALCGLMVLGVAQVYRRRRS